ncbi:hypothetical protein [Paenibacillus paeoniae]|uniref:Uncharacterized protein n=1 Tax=Paenibacillus paeoniae TaxID=2292705 RepID=A0A371P079_9BACL|nr:hypothetical protein [Paenibacillus paeoniae]REK69339.1 hypothetical protein DX130_24575 [Paenibacillus paeoniae]
MRLLKRDQRSVAFKERVEAKELDGTSYTTYSDVALTIKGNVQPAGGKVMAEQYGERLAYMLVMYVEGNPGVKESAGAWVNVAGDSTEPDYKVVAIRPWRRHAIIEMEKVTP